MNNHPQNQLSETKIALVTGASRGLGRATALRLGRDGFTVAVHYNGSQAAAAEVVREITQAGGRAFALAGDVSTLAGIRSLFEQLDAQVIPLAGAAVLDVLVNNAGTALTKGDLSEWTEEDFDRQFDLNVKGLFFVTQHALPRLREGGRIINLGTGLTRFSYAPYAVYAASKGAVDVLSQYLAAILGPRGITVNTLAPGAIDTDLNAGWLRSEQGRAQTIASSAIKRVGLPEDIADAVSFLASADSRWVTGQRIEASGGAHL